ncbi:MAG: Ig domain-containing protein, partial [Bacteroidales bacterium]|nr:Ig domain-containing protein [Bacteroidales bacterium]
MRKTTKLLSALMMVAALMTACQVESLEKLDTVRTVKFSAGEAEATRTVFASSGTGTKLPVLWTSNQDVRIFPSQFSGAINAPVVPSSDQKTASFTGEMSFSTTARSAFYLLSPASVFSRHVSDKIVEINLPSSQTPTATSVDENAQVLVASTPVYRPVPETVTLNPTHLTAYMALRLTDFTAAGKNPTVEVTSASAVLSGKAQYNYADGSLTPDSESSSNKVSAPVLSASKPVFLACLPAQVAGTKMLIRVKGLSGTLNKEITIPSDKNLTSGTVAVLTVSMAQTVPVTGVSVSPTTLSLETGQTGNLTATVTPSNATNKTVTWSSSNTNVATVSSTGVVTAVAAGTATITATTAVGGKTATCAVTVTAATVEPTGVSVSPTSLNLKINKTSTLTATVTPTNATNKTVTWSSSNTSVATVSSSGVVTAKKVGTATITATTVNGLKATCAVTVPNSLMSIDFSARAHPAETDYHYDSSENVFHMAYGQSTTINYWATYADGSSGYFSSGALQLEVISGSGIAVNDNQSIRCTASGKSAVIKVTYLNDTSIYSNMTVKTWDPVTSMTIIKQYDDDSGRNGILGWMKENTSSQYWVKIEPSTARQKAVVFKAENDAGWNIGRQSGNDGRFVIKAPAVNGSTASAYTSKAVTLTIIN